ncbi:hypothetical protein DOE76_00125 [Leifsonia sp. ku-ls]|nr:hypothetical protein DOE76_00125 [Leifsonia sp. ku-ls]
MRGGAGRGTAVVAVRVAVRTFHADRGVRGPGERGEVTILEHHYGASVQADAVVHPVWSLSARTAHEGGVRVGTVGGVSVGSGVDQVAGWNDPDRLGSLALDDHTSAELLVVAAPGYPLVPDGARGAYGVFAVADVYPGSITMLTAPSQHGGA